MPQATLRAVGGVGEGIDGRDLECEFDPAHSCQVDGEAEQVGRPGERWQRPGEGERKVKFVGWLLVLGQEDNGILERKEDAGVDVQGEVQVQRAAAPLFGVQIDLPDLPQGVGLDEVPLVVDVESVVDGVVLQVGDVPRDVNGSHNPESLGRNHQVGVRGAGRTTVVLPSPSIVVMAQPRTHSWTSLRRARRAGESSTKPGVASGRRHTYPLTIRWPARGRLLTGGWTTAQRAGATPPGRVRLPWTTFASSL